MVCLLSVYVCMCTCLCVCMFVCVCAICLTHNNSNVCPYIQRVQEERGPAFLLQLPSGPRSWMVDKRKELGSWPPSSLAPKMESLSHSQLLGLTLGSSQFAPLLLSTWP